MKIAVIFDNFGPYHLARLRAISKGCSLLGIQVRAKSREYLWNPQATPSACPVATLQPDGVAGSTLQLAARLRNVLQGFSPDCVFIPGWSSRASLAALLWCLRRHVPAVLMSETTADDLPRSRWKESLKRRILSTCSAAFVGGTRQADYLRLLRFPPDAIFSGYDAVDNQYFSSSAAVVREQPALFKARFGLPDHYFLACARFIPRKNLRLIVRAFAKYRSRPSADPKSHKPWSLVILGDGPDRPALETQIQQLGLADSVFLPGFKQYGELPAYYALAGAFIHAANSEPWGLVVNEAMAAALPILVSTQTGCARDLVEPGTNGFLFNAHNGDELAARMRQIVDSPYRMELWGRPSAQRISAWGLKRFALGFFSAAQHAAAGSRVGLWNPFNLKPWVAG